MDAAKSIVVVDDEPDILELVSLHLRKSGYKVDAFTDGKSFYNSLKTNNPSLIILDLMLPDMDGLEICKDIKKSDKYMNIPVIMLTARGEEAERVLGLELGADDYVTKPFSPRELVARVNAVLRRPNHVTNSRQIKIGEKIKMDIDRYELQVENKKINLTSTEFRILHLLASKKGWVFSRNEILDSLWGQEKVVVDRSIDVHIKHLREKLGSESSLIVNVRGVGYKIQE